ncbi:hypothetical protein D9757_002151 [Collybiopsis confluens]|uniref:Uncharacterized protein n=1 Tax=Collybiopsis confluens TaxID=2823264 RepID=A0A8H5MFX2_9AGAR|nr:hypothetical protein D9757_002151 [Collybiopsis confluens]
MSSNNLPENTDEAESSLQSTIQRLDQAFERIRSLRRDILQEQANISRAGLSPGHEAILLTGQEGNEEELERHRANIPADTRERLRQFETRRTERDRIRAHSHLLRAAAAHMHPLDTSITPSSSHPSSAQLPLSFASPLSPPRQRLLPHRILDTVTQPLRRRESSDDPNTEIGRRVAARESARSVARDTAVHNPSRDGPHRLPTVIERDFEYTTRTRLRRSEPAFARVEQSLDQLRREVENRVSRSLDAAGALVSPSSESSARLLNLRSNRSSQSRQGSNPSTNAASATSTQSRLSLLSNFPVHNLPTPSATLSSTPLLFEEPAGLVHDERMQSINEEDQRALEDRYRSHLRLGWDGRGDQDFLFTSSPVQMHHEPDALRTAHLRNNTVQVSGAPRQFILDANGEETHSEESAPARTLIGGSLGLYMTGPVYVSGSVPRDEYHVSAAQEANTLDISVPPTNQDLEEGAHYYVVPPDCGTFCSGTVPDPKPWIFGTTNPRYIDPLPSALVDKFTTIQPKVQPKAKPPVLRICTTRASSVAGR